MDIIYLAACPEVVIYVEDYKIRALLDGGSEINIINKIIAKSLDLAVSPY